MKSNQRAHTLGFAKSVVSKDRWFGFLMAGPGITVLLVIILFPILFAIFASFYDYTLIRPVLDRFTGTENYSDALSDQYLRSSVMVTVAYVAASVMIEFAIGLTIALALQSVTRFKPLYYFVLLIPLLINPVVVGLMWRMILHSELGIANYLLGEIGIGPINWLGNPQTAFWTIVLVDVWHQVSFMAILLLAGLSALPKDPYEAARMDGASTLQMFFTLTLPLLKPVIVVTLLIRMIFAIKSFDIVYIMTKGGPGTATDLISYYIYRTAFSGLDLGKASALSVALLVVIILLTAAFNKTLTKDA